MNARNPTVRPVTSALLRKMPLPRASAEDDKEARGRVLVIGGTARTPGALLLAGMAALRAGAGKLQLGTVASTATPLALAVPEALVLALPESARGDIATRRARRLLGSYVRSADVTLVGPGMMAGRESERLVLEVAATMPSRATLILDAGATLSVTVMQKLPRSILARTIITPNASEMATLLGKAESTVRNGAAEIAAACARKWGLAVALKGACTWIADPQGALYCYRDGVVGLGTSGSGDVLAGVIAGLSARGASPIVASLWGIHAHGSAGRRLSKRVGRLGYLARELLDEVPSFTNAPSRH